MDYYQLINVQLEPDLTMIGTYDRDHYSPSRLHGEVDDVDRCCFVLYSFDNKKRLKLLWKILCFYHRKSDNHSFEGSYVSPD